jgi:hypothetical protein
MNVDYQVDVLQTKEYPSFFNEIIETENPSVLDLIIEKVIIFLSFHSFFKI